MINSKSTATLFGQVICQQDWHLQVLDLRNMFCKRKYVELAWAPHLTTKPRMTTLQQVALYEEVMD